MSNFLKSILVSSIILFSNSSITSDFNEALETIETRKTAMQSLWERIKRLSPYVELKEKVDYDKDLAALNHKKLINNLNHSNLFQKPIQFFF